MSALGIDAALLLLGLAGGAGLTLLRVNAALSRAATALDISRLSDPPPNGPRWLTGMAALLEAHARLLQYHQQTIEKLSDEADVMVERYESLTENLAAAIVIRDPQGRISYCSPYTEVLTGFSLDEIYRCQDADFFYRIVHPEDREPYLKAMRVSACGGEAYQFRYRFFHKTGIEMWAESRTVPVMDERGEIRYSLSITFDVTGLIRRQQQIEEKNRDLEDFSYMISHDLKAPIFTVKGMIQILQEDYAAALQGGAAETLEHMTAAVHRLEQLVQSVVEYSRISNRETVEEAVELRPVLDDIRAEFQAQLSACGGTLQIQENLPAVRADRLKLYQIFSNLVGNAVKYRSPERPLAVEIGEVPDDNERFVRIRVRDNGLGVPAGRIKDIFRPFQRAHGREIEGSGIGLACVKKLVTEFGGETGVESREGSGTDFFVTLPRDPAAGRREDAAA